MKKLSLSLLTLAVLSATSAAYAVELEKHDYTSTYKIENRNSVHDFDLTTFEDNMFRVVTSGRGMQKRNFDSELKSLNDRPSNQASICKATSSPKLNGVF